RESAADEIRENDYRNLAVFILRSDGTIKRASGANCGGKGAIPPACPVGWTFGAGTWSSAGSMPSAATYYVEGNVSMKGTGNNPVTALSVIAEGNINLEGNGKFRPEN